MEESGSEGLEGMLMARQDTKFMKEVDYCCISDNYWLGKEKPCLTYGLRGVCYFFIEVECAAMDLHSGVFGGTVNEGMADLIWMMNQLVSEDGTILVEGLMDSVAPLTEEEKAEDKRFFARAAKVKDAIVFYRMQYHLGNNPVYKPPE